MNYNPVVYKILDVAETERCHFVYASGKRCKRDGHWRIGQTVYLCGYHMPGQGMVFRKGKPILVESSKHLATCENYLNGG